LHVNTFLAGFYQILPGQRNDAHIPTKDALPTKQNYTLKLYNQEEFKQLLKFDHFYD
jgi:hypothetical protein